VAAPTAARVAALESLRGVRAGALADRSFDSATRGLDARERAWAQELVYGTLRLRGRLDHLLAGLSNRPLDELNVDVLDVLRLGAYQLTEMDSVPAYAAVSQSVELTKRSMKGAAGFVNGVLQSLRRQLAPPGAGATAAFPSFETNAVAHLCSWGSHPRWLVERWIARYGLDGTRRLVEANNRRPELYLRAGSQLMETGREPRPARDVVRSLLRDAGVETEPVSFAPRALRVVRGSAAAAVDAAPVIVQDPAAGLVVDCIGATTGTVLDLAAAPGGKALALALMPLDSGTRFVAAADRSFPRLGRFVENARRLSRPPPAGMGAVPAVAVVADGRAPPFRSAPTVLLDAPCTGTGTLRRHPDGRWRIGPDDLTSLAALQASLLHAAAALVEPRGLLVYATCSLEPEENEMQVSAFLERHTDFAAERCAGVADTLVHDDGTLRVLPHEHGVDGAFCARLRRH
jgi:16S rRNA (cytosine967-C5)-methyltransferase